MVQRLLRAHFLWSLTALWSILGTATAQDDTMPPSQTPSLAVSRITVASMFTSNGNVSVTSTPTLPPLAIVPAAVSDPFAAVPPTVSPTVKPSAAPALSITNVGQEGDEVAPASVVKATLPEIAIGVETASDQTLETSSKDQKLMNDFWQGFVDNLLMASDLIPSSLFQSTTLNVSLETSENHSLLFIVNGTAYFHMDQPPRADELQNSLRQSFASYLSFWGTSEMEQSLKDDYGLSDASITSISVGGKREVEGEENVRSNVEWEGNDAGAASMVRSIGVHLLVAACVVGTLALC